VTLCKVLVNPLLHLFHRLRLPRVLKHILRQLVQLLALLSNNATLQLELGLIILENFISHVPLHLLLHLFRLLLLQGHPNTTTSVTKLMVS